jgi:hypothetical protein
MHSASTSLALAHILAYTHVAKQQASDNHRHEVEKTEKSLRVFSDTMDEWLECQRQWLYLETIFRWGVALAFVSGCRENGRNRLWLCFEAVFWSGIYIYGIFGKEITKYMVIYGVNMQLWPTLLMCISCTVICEQKLAISIQHCTFTLQCR